MSGMDAVLNITRRAPCAGRCPRTTQSAVQASSKQFGLFESSGAMDMSSFLHVVTIAATN